MLRQAVILAGDGDSPAMGQGGETPIPMSSVDDRPLLDVLVRHLACFGLHEIVIVTGVRGDLIEDYFDDGSKWGVHIRYAPAIEPGGTGGFLRLSTGLLDERFLLLDGNILFDINYLDLASLQARHSSLCAMALCRARDEPRDARERLCGRQVAGVSGVDHAGAQDEACGVYVLMRDAAEYVPDIPCSFTKDVVPRLVANSRVVGRYYDGFFVDIRDPGSLAESRRSIPAWWRRPIAFLDRDGVINRDVGYLSSPERFEWVDGAPEAIRLLNENGYRVVVVTNQSGIARGYYDESDFHRLMDWVTAALQPYGAHIDAIYYCPHHPCAGIAHLLSDCACRKPEPGLLTQALADFPANAEDCFLVGDKRSDLQAAAAAGVTGYLFDETANLAELITRLLNLEKRL